MIKNITLADLCLSSDKYTVVLCNEYAKSNSLNGGDYAALGITILIVGGIITVVVAACIQSRRERLKMWYIDTPTDKQSVAF